MKFIYILFNYSAFNPFFLLFLNILLNVNFSEKDKTRDQLRLKESIKERLTFKGMRFFFFKFYFIGLGHNSKA